MFFVDTLYLVSRPFNYFPWLKVIPSQTYSSSLPVSSSNLLQHVFHCCLTQFQLLEKHSVLHSSVLCWSAPRNTLIITPWMLPWATWSFPSSMMSLGIKSICAWCFGIIPYYLYLWPVFASICAFFSPPLARLIAVLSFAISLAIVLYLHSTFPFFFSFCIFHSMARFLHWTCNNPA